MRCDPGPRTAPMGQVGAPLYTFLSSAACSAAHTVMAQFVWLSSFCVGVAAHDWELVGGRLLSSFGRLRQSEGISLGSAFATPTVWAESSTAVCDYYVFFHLFVDCIDRNVRAGGASFSCSSEWAGGRTGWLRVRRLQWNGSSKREGRLP